jgi:hypothetical protein
LAWPHAALVARSMLVASSRSCLADFSALQMRAFTIAAMMGSVRAACVRSGGGGAN